MSSLQHALKNISMAILLSAVAFFATLASPATAHAASDGARSANPKTSPSPTTPSAPPPATSPATPVASPSPAAPAASPEAAPAPQTLDPSGSDMGQDEPSAEDAALQDDPAQQEQSAPETEQDTVFTSTQYRIDTGAMKATDSTQPATINYEMSGPSGAYSPCERMIKAHVVALDQIFFWNRLGAVQPQGMIFALRQNVVPTDGSAVLRPGRVRLRADKRPRPLVLRMNVGDCLQIDFQNLLNPSPVDEEQPITRTASVHVAGLQLVNSIHDDGSNVGRNQPSGLVRPGERTTYTFYADGQMREGVHLLYSTAATTTSEGDGGQLPPGLFGAVDVEPRRAEWYRSQLSNEELRLAAKRNPDGSIKRTPGGQPILNYDAVYPAWHRYAFQPIIRILNRNGVIAHSDLNAIITGPGRGKFPAGTYPPVGVAPNRDWPFREFTIVYHDEIGAVQAFPQFEQQGPGGLADTLHASRDNFAINYGTAGIGAEIIANRIGVGPEANCDECLFEEFFLSAWSVGDPAMVVDRPANSLRDNIVGLPPCKIGSAEDNIANGLRDGRCDENRKDVPPGYKATVAFYPADPSNVHHSYIGDHVKMRVLHAGPKEHHIHHLHAHQWIKSADGDGSTYNDSQAIGPGSGFNLEISHGGSGNRNLTPGDAIFHCHFYPHFAQGMWELWRNHDVFEEGTPLDGGGRPIAGTRALPDAEIKRGTPIPALVPLPGGADQSRYANYVMAPMPEAQVQIVNGQVAISGNGNPGYPFFVPGIMGRRPPHPPLDTEFDAGLPRHVIKDADVAFHEETRLSFDKEIKNIQAQELPEDGTFYEKRAMDYHALPYHTGYRTEDRTPGPFLTNGLPPQPGAPYADPCVSDRFDPNGNEILEVHPFFNRKLDYKAVMFQFDMQINKAGWHFPQARIESLWRDYAPTVNGTKPPEPMFIRANTQDCITFHHANLIPKVYQVDDFQVKTPTDIVGQHIHLVKFDVTSSDGAGNGWNYEDGTFGDEEVVTRINHINETGGIITINGGRRILTPVPHPFFNRPAQVTIQRWFADDVVSLNPAGTAPKDRTLRSAFTHDHFGPSTHQQTGLYAGLIMEPKDSEWLHNETGTPLGYSNNPTPVRDDGGPTSFAAVIVTHPDTTQSFREFMIEFADYQLAYLPKGGVDGAGKPIPDPKRAINPPGRHEVPIPDQPLPGPPFGPETRLLERPAREGCPNGDPAPCPEILSGADVGTFVVNYRNEPIALRVRNPSTNTQAAGDQGDLSFSYKSIQRADPALNAAGPYPPLTPGVGVFDPFTPLLRANERDRVNVRILVGAHEEGHNFTVHGVKWLFEPSDPDSGWRNSEMMGISEKFDFVLPGVKPNGTPGDVPKEDHLYKPGAAVDDQWNGLWGILRVYRQVATNGAMAPERMTTEEPPFALPNNPPPTTDKTTASTTSASDTDSPIFIGPPVPAEISPCPDDAKPRSYTVFAYLARDILRQRRLEFDGQDPDGAGPQTPYHWNIRGESSPLNDPTAIIYVRKDMIGDDGFYKNDRVEPLVLRANAGECITVTLFNRLPPEPVDLPGYNTLPMIVDDFNANQVVPSRRVGLHPQLVHYDVTTSDGFEVGVNPNPQTAPPGGSVTYTWYAGNTGIELTPSTGEGKPVEFGATNLVSSDPIKHSNKSAIGSLIIEPQGSNWQEDADSTHSATVWKPTGGGCPNCGVVMVPFREFVLQFQNDVNMRFNDGSPVPHLAEEEDPEDTGQKAFNYRTEPFWTRLCYWPALPLSGGMIRTATQCPQSDAQSTRQLDMTNSLHNSQIGGRDPITPIFSAMAGDEVRFRVLMSNGHPRNNVFMVHGHIWQEMPYQTGSSSSVIGFNNNSAWHGSQWGHGPSDHFDVRI
ncbi:MAG: manganese oxidase, partial [Acidobacteriota bacterium]|nr:manganese oxidase [Acidobacteriota bacterium]